ncbi:putative quinol monooxygenase [Aestuariivirga sp.]|jgi:autoinducer 2-degrading protein|uniref:putative quinol monooxygenase n=1 Tax=Aestuariivirga sp. TaxID=2650926 RepID=UPI003783B7D6
MAFVVLVEMNVKSAELMPAFRSLIEENARLSVKNEPGCWRFDVVLPHDNGTQIILYELYEDEDAFSAHLKAEHFLAFHAASEMLLASRVIRRGTLVCEASAIGTSA